MAESVIDDSKQIEQIMEIIEQWLPVLESTNTQKQINLEACAAQIMQEMVEDFRLHAANFIPLTEANNPFFS